MTRAAALCLALLLCACPPPADPDSRPDDHEVPPPSNRIDVPEAVRRNLGISFAKAEYRRVRSTRRYPGQVELLPTATRDYPAPLAGRVMLGEQVAVDQPVAAGALLYTLSAPAWLAHQRDWAAAEATLQRARGAERAAQLELTTAAAKLKALDDALTAGKAHIDNLERQIEALDARLARLQKLAGAGKALELEQAKIDRAGAVASLSEANEEHADRISTRIELAARLASSGSSPSLLTLAHASARAGREAAAVRLQSLQQTAALWHGQPLAWLLERVEGGARRWQTLRAIEVRASRAGVIRALTTGQGGWAEAGASVLQVVKPSGLRFVARAPQTHLAQLSDGLRCLLVPPRGAGLEAQPAAEGSLRIAVSGDPHARTHRLIIELSGEAPSWARPGMAAFVEVQLGVGPRELAIPRAAVIRDGLVDVFFRRDPRDPDKVIRVEADLGATDGRWVEVRSGVAEGNEVVVEGAYPLMLASSGQANRKGGHFHADGTWHEGEH